MSYISYFESKNDTHSRVIPNVCLIEYQSEDCQGKIQYKNDSTIFGTITPSQHGCVKLKKVAAEAKNIKETEKGLFADIVIFLETAEGPSFEKLCDSGHNLVPLIIERHDGSIKWFELISFYLTEKSVDKYVLEGIVPRVSPSPLPTGILYYMEPVYEDSSVMDDIDMKVDSETADYDETLDYFKKRLIELSKIPFEGKNHSDEN